MTWWMEDATRVVATTRHWMAIGGSVASTRVAVGRTTSRGRRSPRRLSQRQRTYSVLGEGGARMVYTVRYSCIFFPREESDRPTTKKTKTPATTMKGSFSWIPKHQPPWSNRRTLRRTDKYRVISNHDTIAVLATNYIDGRYHVQRTATPIVRQVHRRIKSTTGGAMPEIRHTTQWGEDPYEDSDSLYDDFCCWFDRAQVLDGLARSR